MKININLWINTFVYNHDQIVIINVSIEFVLPLSMIHVPRYGFYPVIFNKL